MIYLPFILQGIVMIVDEFHVHEKRGLPLWERLGHPLDSLTVVAAFLFLLNFPPTPQHEKFYLGLCIFSCVFITKDEFIHHQESSALEHWLHSMLFLLHPVTFGCAWIIWKENPEHPFLVIQTVITAAFMTYQILRWSVLWPKSITHSMKPSEKDGTKPGMTPSPFSARKEKLSISGSSGRS